MPDCGIGWKCTGLHHTVRTVTAMPDTDSHARDDRPTPLIPLEATRQRSRVSLVWGVVWGLVLALILGLSALWTTRRGTGTTTNVNVGPVIVADPSTPTPLPIQVGPPELIPQQAWIRIVGLPASASLSEGQAISPGLWSVPVMRLAGLAITAPAGEGIRSSVSIALVSPRGSVLAEAQSMLVVIPAARLVVTGGQFQFRSVAPPSSFELACPEVAASQYANAVVAPTHRWSEQEGRRRAEILVQTGDRRLPTATWRLRRSSTSAPWKWGRHQRHSRSALPTIPTRCCADTFSGSGATSRKRAAGTRGPANWRTWKPPNAKTERSAIWPSPIPASSHCVSPGNFR